MKERCKLNDFNSNIHESFVFHFGVGGGDSGLLLRAPRDKSGVKIDQLLIN